MTMARDDLFGSMNSSSISELTVASSTCLKLFSVDVEPLCILIFGEAKRLAGEEWDETGTET